MTNKFSFYEVVMVDSDLPKYQTINHHRGIVVGMSQNENDHSWGYAVSIESVEKCWSIDEQYLKSTGEFRQREDIYKGESVTVVVDPKTGKGSVRES